MAMELHTVPYGADATVALREAVATAKGGDPLAPVTVVVPSNHVGVACRRALGLGSMAGGAGVAAVAFMTPYRLAELLGAGVLAAEGKRPVSTPVLAAAVRAELTADAGLFEPVATHPATESALVTTYQELRDLSPAALAALADPVRTSDRAAEVVRLHRGTRARLAAGWSDEQDLCVAAIAVAPERAAAELGALVVYLPQRLSQHSARLLVALATHVPTTVIAGTTGVADADAEVSRSLTRLGLSADLPVGRLPATAGRTEVLTASDADEEVRAAVRAVVTAVRGGTRLDRIAVLHASPEPYARLSHEQLAAAGIRTNGTTVSPLSARVAGRTLLDLLALPVGGYRRAEVFAWLTAAPILVGGRRVATSAWERISREAAVVAGRDDWDHLLVRHMDRLELRAVEIEQDDDEPESRAEGIRRDVARARELREFVLSVIGELATASARPKRWADHATWARRWLGRLLGGPIVRERWTDPAERKAAERVEEALHRLAALDVVEGPVTLDVFTRTLELELEHDLGRVGRFGEGVLVGSVEMGIGIDLDLVVVLGLAEGSFPATVRDDSLLPDHERVVAGGELGLRADRVERQHRQLLACLAGADRHLLCVPRGDLRRSVERVPSRWVLDLATAVEGGELLTRLPAKAAWLTEVASFDHGLRVLDVPSTEQEHRLRGILAAGGELTSSDDGLTRRGATVVEARRSDRFTEFDGNLGAVEVRSPLAQLTSPTRLERWAECPHRHLVEDLLHAPPIENPEEHFTITPRDKGSLIHAALEDFLRAVLERPIAERPRPHQAWTDDDRVLLQELGAKACDDYETRGLVGRPIFWRRDRRRILIDLDLALRADAAHRVTHGTIPLQAELAFGFREEDAIDHVSVVLPDGRTLMVRGRIDRVDAGTDGSIHVIDYKTGRIAGGYEKLTEDNPVAGGTKLQLPIYGLAGRVAVGKDVPVQSEYWFATSAGGFKRIGYPLTDAVLETTRAVLGTIVENVELGVFPPHPPALSTFFRVGCQVCNPDGLGTAELRKQWERKRLDPALAAYVALAEPPEEEVEA